MDFVLVVNVFCVGRHSKFSLLLNLLISSIDPFNRTEHMNVHVCFEHILPWVCVNGKESQQVTDSSCSVGSIPTRGCLLWAYSVSSTQHALGSIVGKERLVWDLLPVPTATSMITPKRNSLLIQDELLSEQVYARELAVANNLTEGLLDNLKLRYLLFSCDFALKRVMYAVPWKRQCLLGLIKLENMSLHHMCRTNITNQ